MISHKTEKLNSLIREELSDIIRRELEFSQGVLVSVGEAVCTPDLGTAKIWLNIWPEEAKDEVLKILRKNQGFLRSELAIKIEMRRVPRFRFIMDKEELEDERQRNTVEGILAKLKEEEKKK
jgi:ribosome-binding factor A